MYSVFRRDLKVAAVESLYFQIEALCLTSRQKDLVGTGKKIRIANASEAVYRRKDSPVSADVSILVLLALIVALNPFKQGTLIRNKSKASVTTQQNDRHINKMIISKYAMFG